MVCVLVKCELFRDPSWPSFWFVAHNLTFLNCVWNYWYAFLWCERCRARNETRDEQQVRERLGCYKTTGTALKASPHSPWQFSAPFHPHHLFFFLYKWVHKQHKWQNVLFCLHSGEKLLHACVSKTLWNVEISLLLLGIRVIYKMAALHCAVWAPLHRQDNRLQEQNWVMPMELRRQDF